jgi:hypothetical protein
MGADRRLWRLSWLIALLFWWKIVASLAWVVLTRVNCVLIFMPACNISYVDLLMFPFDVFWGMCGKNSCNVFLMFLMVLWVRIFATLCRRAVLMPWHTFLFL